MAGEKGSLNLRSTRSIVAKAAVAAGEECVLKPCQHGHGLIDKRKRKAAGDESAPKVCTIKGKAPEIGSSDLKQGAAPVNGEAAPGKRMTRLPQEEVDSILATVMDDDRLPPEYRALKRHSPDLIPSPEEEMDEELVSFYDVVREFYAVGVEFREFQAWVRSEYAKNGYVEVDDEFLAKRAEGRVIIEEARKDAIKDFDFSDLID